MNNASLTSRRKYLSLLAIPVYIALCAALLPWFKEIIDPDDTAYLRIAERYAAGNWRQAVNGMWSPLNSWIGALFLPWGIKPLLLFKYLNIGFGCIVLLAVRSLLQKSGLAVRFHLAALLGLIPFAIYATYHELAADWLQCALLLLYLNLIFSESYPERMLYPVLCGLLGALAYYAKYYNFHFFWLHFTVANFFWYYRWSDRKLEKRFWHYTGAGILMLVLLALPWVILLHGKYGFWKLNYTGVYDLAWSLDPQLVAKHTKALLPPTLPGASSYLEDPIWLKHSLVTPFSGIRYFIRQAGISGLSVAGFLTALSLFSALLPAVVAIALFRFFRGQDKTMSFDLAAVLVILTLPAGYLLFHVEPRFIWPVCILGYILGLKLLQQYILPRISRNAWKLLIAAGFMATFCVHPALDLAGNIHRDDEVQHWAKAIAPLHLQGTFITNSDQNKVVRLAYLSGMSLAIRREDAAPDDLMSDIADFKVNYYFEFSQAPGLFPCAVTGQLAEVTGGKLPYLKIYRLY